MAWHIQQRRRTDYCEMLIPSVLKALLSLKRPHGGAGERAAQVIVQASVAASGQEWSMDRFGNIVVQVGEDNGAVFTSHLDTVHRADGPIVLGYIEETGEIVGDTEEGKACVLGADDAAGVFILTEMIAAGVQGKYLFFVGEEVGGIGSSQFVIDNPTFSANFVVSFDRKGTSDIITHQGGERTASDEFAKGLGLQLYKASAGKLRYMPCTTGLYTDSKEFIELVPECTNVAVGYYNEHTVQESLHLAHLLELRDAVLKVDWSALPIKRNPSERGADWRSYYERWDAGYTLDDLKRAKNWCRGRIDDGELDVNDVEHLLDILETFV